MGVRAFILHFFRAVTKELLRIFFVNKREIRQYIFLFTFKCSI